jgi:uncharacterized damage-inducible protein DinB
VAWPSFSTEFQTLALDRAERGKPLKNKRISLIACALLLVISATSGLRAQSPAAGSPGAYAADAGQLSEKFVGLARVMAGKYDWKPGQGVRSVSDVFNLIVTENQTLTRTLTGAAAPSGPRPAPITDPEKLQDALKSSYADLQKTINGLSASDLQAPVKLFGRDMSKQGAIALLLSDQHEHLGQSIAYARMNSVVPPWSK